MTINRESILKAAQLVRPAIASQDYIKALTHLRLGKSGITAYNDISALSVDIEHDLECCVPGDLFIRALSGFAGKDVSVEPHPKEQAVILKSGKGKLKLPTLPHADFPFRWPTDKPLGSVAFDDDLLKGLQECLVSVGNNPNHPAQMGVTLDVEDGKAVCFATDNISITRYATSSPLKLPADAPIILPTFFCEQTLALAKAFPAEELNLDILPGAVMLEVGDGKARLFMKQMVEIEPLDFGTNIKRRVSSFDKLRAQMVEIPAGFEGALQRAALVTQVLDPAVEISSIDDGLFLAAKSEMGEHDDVLECKVILKDPVSLNPQLMLRASGRCTHFHFGPQMLIMGTKDAKLLHIIAYYGK